MEFLNSDILFNTVKPRLDLFWHVIDEKIYFFLNDLSLFL